MPKLCQNPICLGRGELLFERKQFPQVVDKRHFRVELLELLEPEIILRKKSWLFRECYQSEPVARPLARRSTTDDREVFGAALAETRGRVAGPSGAAVKLGIPASTLESRIRSLRINKYHFMAC